VRLCSGWPMSVLFGAPLLPRVSYDWPHMDFARPRTDQRMEERKQDKRTLKVKLVLLVFVASCFTFWIPLNRATVPPAAERFLRQIHSTPKIKPKAPSSPFTQLSSFSPLVGHTRGHCHLRRSICLQGNWDLGGCVCSAPVFIGCS
jgi:hypothetical protein